MLEYVSFAVDDRLKTNIKVPPLDKAIGSETRYLDTDMQVGKHTVPAGYYHEVKSLVFNYRNKGSLAPMGAGSQYNLGTVKASISNTQVWEARYIDCLPVSLPGANELVNPCMNQYQCMDFCDGVELPSDTAIHFSVTPGNATAIRWEVDLYMARSSGTAVLVEGDLVTIATTANQTLLSWSTAGSVWIKGFNFIPNLCGHVGGPFTIRYNENYIMESRPIGMDNTAPVAFEGTRAAGGTQGCLAIPLWDMKFYPGENIAMYVAPWSAASDVWSMNIAYDEVNTSGGGTFPSANDARQGVSYGPTGSDYTGTIQLPSATSVVDGIGYGSNATENTGTCVLPSQTSVAVGVSYGGDGTEYTGTLASGGGGRHTVISGGW